MKIVELIGMLKKEFSICVAERHHVVVTVSSLTRSLHVMIDGKEVPETESGVFAPDFTMPRRTFMFGERERHTIGVKVDYRFVRPQLSVYLDGTPLDTAPNVTLL